MSEATPITPHPVQLPAEAERYIAAMADAVVTFQHLEPSGGDA